MAKRISMSSSGLKISRPGFDVDTATAAQLALNLGVNYGQIMQEGDIAASGSVTLSGFSVAPLVFFYSYLVNNMKDPGGATITAYHVPDQIGSQVGSKVQISNTSLAFTLNNANKCRYLIVRNQRN